MREPTWEKSITIAVTATKIFKKQIILQIIKESTLERSITDVVTVVSPLQIVVVLDDTK